jgi:hypothetical protein
MAIRINVVGAYDDKDIRRAQRDLDKLGGVAGTTSATFSQRFADMGASMAAFGMTMTTKVTLPIVAAGGAMFALFTKQEDALARMTGALRANGGQANVTAEEIQDLASRLQETTTYGDEATISAAGLLLTFHKVRNEFGEGNRVFDRTLIAAQDLAAALGTDLESATMQLAKALENPEVGLTALSRSGTTFTEQQKDMIRAMVDAGDTLGAQKMILETVESQYGGMAETMAGTSSGRIKQAFNELGDAGEQFGEIIANVVDKFTAGLKAVGEFLKNLSPEMRELIVTGAAIAAAIGPVLLIVGKLMGAIVAIKGVFAGLAAAVSAPVLIVVAIIAALVAAFVIAWQRSEEFRNTVTKVFNEVRDAVIGAWEGFIKPALDDLVAAFENHIAPALDNLAAKFNEVWPSISSALASFWGYAQPVLQFLVNILTNVLIPVLGFLLNTAFTVFTGMAGFLAGAWTNVFQPTLSGISSIVRNVVIPAFMFLWNVARTVWSGVSGAISTAWGFMAGVFESIKGGISGVATWFSDRVNDIKGVFSGIADAISGPFQVAFDAVKAIWNNTLGGKGVTIPDIPGLPGRGQRFEFPTFDKGGMVPGIPGEPQLAIVHAGEMILRRSEIDGYRNRPEQGGGRSGDVYVTVNKTDANPYDIGRELLWQMKVAG